MTKNKTNTEPKHPSLPDGVTSKKTVNPDDATTTISVVAPFKLLATRKDAALKRLTKGLKADGFRPGKLPADYAKKQIPEIMVLDEAGRDLIGDIYLPLLQEHAVDGIGEPKLQITKLAADNPFEFSITLYNAPEITLGDYKKTRDNADNSVIDPEISDEELENAIKTLQLQWAQQDIYQKTLAENPDDAKGLDPRQIKVSDDQLPELTDEWVKQLGEYDNVADFKEKFRSNIKANQAMQELQKRRADILEEIIADATFSIPEIVYAAEQDRVLELQKEEIKQSGISFADYLKAIERSEKDLRDNLRTRAENNVKYQMTIAEIAKNESLSPDKETIDAEVEHLQTLYPQVSKANLVAFVRSQLINNLVMQWLAQPKVSKKETETDNKKPKKTSKPKDSNK